jgi:SAM-dependent methyltransferase
MHEFTRPNSFVGGDLVRWNLGAGERPIPGFINQDLYPGEGIDKVFDLNEDWPIEDNSVDDYICLHTLEHLDDPIHFFREVQRTLKVGGTITVETPYGNSDAAMADPTHKRPFYLGTYGMFTYAQHENYPTFNPQHHENRFPYKFEFVDVIYIVAQEMKRYPLWKWWAIPMSRYLNNIVGAIRVTMRRVER